MNLANSLKLSPSAGISLFINLPYICTLRFSLVLLLLVDQFRFFELQLQIDIRTLRPTRASRFSANRAQRQLRKLMEEGDLNEDLIYKLGKELACPVWDCLQRSISSKETCPVCKKGSKRRDIIRDPKIAHLVAIYKQIELHTGKTIHLLEMPEKDNAILEAAHWLLLMDNAILEAAHGLQRSTRSRTAHGGSTAVNPKPGGLTKTAPAWGDVTSAGLSSKEDNPEISADNGRTAASKGKFKRPRITGATPASVAGLSKAVRGGPKRAAAAASAGTTAAASAGGCSSSGICAGEATSETVGGSKQSGASSLARDDLAPAGPSSASDPDAPGPSKVEVPDSKGSRLKRKSGPMLTPARTLKKGPAGRGRACETVSKSDIQEGAAQAPGGDLALPGGGVSTPWAGLVASTPQGMGRAAVGTLSTGGASPSLGLDTANRRIPSRLQPWGCVACTLINTSTATRCKANATAAKATPKSNLSTPAPRAAVGTTTTTTTTTTKLTGTNVLASAYLPKSGSSEADGKKGGRRSSALSTPAVDSSAGKGTSASRQWAGPAQSWVLIGSALDDGDKDLLRALARKSGAKYVDKFPAVRSCIASRVTHVVCRTDENRFARRTMKYLMGIAMVCGVQGGCPGEPSASRSLSLPRSKISPLLDGLNITLAGKLSSKEEVSSLVVAAGGNLLRSAPTKPEEAPPSDSDAAVVSGFPLLLVDAEEWQTCSPSMGGTGGGQGGSNARARKTGGGRKKLLGTFSSAPATSYVLASHKWLMDSMALYERKPLAQYLLSDQ
eukprot:gene23187-30399_t